MPGHVDDTLKQLTELSPQDWVVQGGWVAAAATLIDADIATITGATDKAIRVAGTPDWLLAVDEPKAALSPTRQLSFLSHLHELVKDGSQFLIATHSPILMAYPDASILMFENGPPRWIEYRDTEHYGVTRTFLNDTERMLDIFAGSQAGCLEHHRQKNSPILTVFRTP